MVLSGHFQICNLWRGMRPKARAQPRAAVGSGLTMPVHACRRDLKGVCCSLASLRLALVLYVLQAVKDKIKIVSCARLLAQAIVSINSGQSVSSLFAVGTSSCAPSPGSSSCRPMSTEVLACEARSWCKGVSLCHEPSCVKGTPSTPHCKQ